MNNQWPKDRVEFVIKQRGLGRTAKEIAGDLKKEFGVVKTRNAVIGILTRNNVPTVAMEKRERANETSRVMGRLRAKPKTVRAIKACPDGPVASPNAKPWPQRCDAPDRKECAYLLNDGLACCNPVAGHGTTFRRRYCAGHLGVMIDKTQRGAMRPSRVEGLAKYATKGERIENGVRTLRV